MNVRYNVLLAALAILPLCAAAQVEGVLDKVREKAVELSQAHTNRAAKITVAHNFVRDEIREIATQWG